MNFFEGVQHQLYILISGNQESLDRTTKKSFTYLDFDTIIAALIYHKASNKNSGHQHL